MRKLTLVLAGLIAIGTLVVASPANATDAYFTIGGTGLAVSEPAPSGGANLGSVDTGSLTAGGQLGNVTVTDGRGALAVLAVWTAKVTSTDFVRDGAGAAPAANEKVTTANTAYSSGAASASSGGVFAPGAVASMAVAENLRIAATFAGTGGNNSATWNPTLTFTLLSSQIAGTYRGTVTHSVA